MSGASPGCVWVLVLTYRPVVGSSDLDVGSTRKSAPQSIRNPAQIALSFTTIVILCVGAKPPMFSDMMLFHSVFSCGRANGPFIAIEMSFVSHLTSTSTIAEETTFHPSFLLPPPSGYSANSSTTPKLIPLPSESRLNLPSILAEKISSYSHYSPCPPPSSL